MSVSELFEPAWKRICEHEGAFFKTEGGRWFTYRVDGDALRPSHSDVRIPRSDLEIAFPMLPVPAAKLNKHVRGPAFVWAVLHDPRIAAGQW